MAAPRDAILEKCGLGAHAAVAKWRVTYREHLSKLLSARDLAAAPIVAGFDAELAALQDQLTKAGRFDDALRVKTYREGGLASKLYGTSAGGGQEAAGPAAHAIFREGILGHALYDPKEVRSLPKNANLILDYTWMKTGEAAIEAAKRLKHKVVLAFSREDQVQVESNGFPLALAHPDVVLGVCWRSPYFDGSTPADVTAFGEKVHQASPSLQFWCSFVEKPRGRYETNPIPPEVDVIVVTSYFAPTAKDVQEKAVDTLPGFIEKAKGRPLLLEWNAWSSSGPGQIPGTKPGTMKAMAKARDENKAVGLILGHFGKTSGGTVGLEENRDLLREIENDVNRAPAPAVQ